MRVFTRCALRIGITAVLVAGCAGPQSPTISSGVPSSRAASRTPDAACKVPHNWYFRGACVSQSLPTSGATFQLSEYRGYALTISLPANNNSGSDTFEVSDADGKGDISGKYDGGRFPPYGPLCYLRGGGTEKCPGKVFYYVHITGDNPNVVTFYGPQTARLTSSDGFPGTFCFPAHIYMYGDTAQWWPDQGLGAQPSGNTLSLVISNPNHYWGTRFHSYVHGVHAFVCR
jgi:hypothetical protein